MPRDGLRSGDTDEDGDPVDWLERARLRDLRVNGELPRATAKADVVARAEALEGKAVRLRGAPLGGSIGLVKFVEADERIRFVRVLFANDVYADVSEDEIACVLVDPPGVSPPNPEATPAAGSAAKTPGDRQGAPESPAAGAWSVDGRPIDVDEDDDDARGWYVNGRPVAARDVDHGDAQAEAENPWTVNGAPIPTPKDGHERCRARLDAERARVRAAIGLLTDVARPARAAIAFLDSKASE